MEEAARITLWARTCWRSSETRVTSVKAVSVLRSLKRLVATFGKSSHDTLNVTGAMSEPKLTSDAFSNFHFKVVILLFGWGGGNWVGLGNYKERLLNLFFVL